ncbi:hypothetical protein LTR10_024054 [Elasticomyces elasticus]|uniref:Uncharacterized protein n=1 Tax=Exophiala sideris TaxID=1016849 RepID=A0ABR0JQR2_9EURO|nr:hypothetical protein LTR10_024054 [Elasticomyces elasticus]KAK5038167.1 hypothetical protein LTS07_001636 [Exophiala sideris]KAK5044151.1 hypothetical protein LTR13_000507 [Exophiala sideris]KAK5067651.1 hypothetical protein LTR69_001640 [Exophiala sideris]KAK5184108.1 hypothetical protein LTR44_003614 [Eurotiomycetes sp. CCFEE 6388]
MKQALDKDREDILVKLFELTPPAKDWWKCSQMQMQMQMQVRNDLHQASERNCAPSSAKSGNDIRADWYASRPQTPGPSHLLSKTHDPHNSSLKSMRYAHLDRASWLRPEVIPHPAFTISRTDHGAYDLHQTTSLEHPMPAPATSALLADHVLDAK